MRPENLSKCIAIIDKNLVFDFKYFYKQNIRNHQDEWQSNLKFVSSISVWTKNIALFILSQTHRQMDSWTDNSNTRTHQDHLGQGIKHLE